MSAVSKVDKDVASSEAVVRRLHEEWDALGLMSYTGDQADLSENDIHEIRALLRDAGTELRWMTESRARWKAACENQGGARAADTAYQMRAFDEEAAR